MPKQGINMLPPAVSHNQLVTLLNKVSDVVGLMGELKSELKYSLVGKHLLTLFFLSESVQSTRIEGTQVTFSDLVEVNLSDRKRQEIHEVLNYQKALAQGFKLIQEGMPFSTRLITELHKTLMTNARDTSSAGGEFRKVQNFIGPDSKIEHAVYIPVPANEIPNYMENLEYYMNMEKHISFRDAVTEGFYAIDENAHPILKLAVMHAQFESIHPFLDGNGRLGRILIALMAVKYNLVDTPVFLVSEELEKERLRYYDLLNAVRGDKPDWYPWLMFFVESSKRMDKMLLDKIHKIQELAKKGFEQCGTDNERSVWLATFSNLRVTAKEVAQTNGIGTATARKYLNSLVSKNLIFCPDEGKRDKRYINYDLQRILSQS